MRSFVFGISKGYQASGQALRGQGETHQFCLMVKQLYLKQSNAGSSPVIENAKVLTDNK